MSSSYFIAPLVFIIEVATGFFAALVMVRFLLGLARASFYNPLARAIVTLTNPLLVPLRRLLPPWGGIDWAAITLLVLIEGAAIALVTWLRVQALPAAGTLAVLVLVALVELLFNVYLVAILLLVLLSWISPGHYNPAAVLLDELTRPVLQPCRRLIPPLGGLDLSPLIALVALQVLKMLLVPPILALA
ncbi:MAG TPA: YggT family protein [Gammaproteobacteria bacterium]|nr:YggT family protein [Gammaproteobacteria bacterium]